jgi:P27 family predicted phage terminase small subunit
MGARGKLKLPPHITVVDGGLDDDDTAPSTAEDVVKRGAPDKPAGWTSVGEIDQLWDQYVAELDEAGLISRLDGMTLELALRHFLASRQASDALASGDALVDDRDGGTKKNPAGAEFRQQSAMFIEYAKQMGFSFAARARIAVPRPDEGEQGDLFGAADGTG